MSRKAGVSLTPVAVPFQQMADGLSSGSIDGALMFEPYLSAALAKGEVDVIAGSESISPHFHVAVLFFSDSYVRSQPDNVAKICSAFDRVVDSVLADPTALKQWIAGHSGIPIEQLENLNLPVWHKRVDVASIEAIQEALIAHGITARRVDVGSHVYEPGSSG
jgi:NitT/TauT family transport system substrate-binding protein